MKAFIEKEAQEKAKEIRVKADEEYEIEKAQIVRFETAAIDAAHAQRLKKALLAQQITKSTIGNKTRLRVLGEKEQAVNDVFDLARSQLASISKDAATYKPILEKLIEEGVLTILEPKVTVTVRKADVDVAKLAAETAAKEFAGKAGFDVAIAVDEELFLDADIAGGVVVRNGLGKIEVDNTLEKRLGLLAEEALPAIRLELFGPTESRKFFT